MIHLRSGNSVRPGSHMSTDHRLHALSHISHILDLYIYTSYYLRNLITKVLYFPNQVVLKLFSGSVVTCNWRTQPLSSASNLCNYVQSVMRQTRCDMPQIKEASECTNQEVLSQPGFPDPVFTGSSQVTSIARC